MVDYGATLQVVGGKESGPKGLSVRPERPGLCLLRFHDKIRASH